MDYLLNEQNCTERINSYPLGDWQPLFELIPEIEKTTSFCKRTQRAMNTLYKFRIASQYQLFYAS